MPTTLFVVSKDEWDTKESTGKSMKNVLYEQWCQKALLRLKWRLTAKKIKPVSLAIAELCLSQFIYTFTLPVTFIGL